MTEHDIESLAFYKLSSLFEWRCMKCFFANQNEVFPVFFPNSKAAPSPLNLYMKAKYQHWIGANVRDEGEVIPVSAEKPTR